MSEELNTLDGKLIMNELNENDYVPDDEMRPRCLWFL